MEGSQPVVIDNGSGVMKAGFAGADRPRVVFRSLVGRTKHVRLMPGGALAGSEIFVGSKVDEHRGILSLNYPIQHGIVQNWADMERLWTYIYSKDHLNVPTEDHPVLLTEAPLNPTANRERTAEIFFEGFNVPALFFSMQAILSLYASGRTSGVVLDCGDGVTHSVPVYEGFALPHAITRMDIAGRDVTHQLQLLLRRAGYVFRTTAEQEVVRQIKEQCCRVAPGEAEVGMPEKVSFTLPDGNVIEMAGEVERAPEVLFRPELIGSEEKGVHDCLVSAVMRSDMDVRRTLFGQVVLSGGTTLLKGFGVRLLAETRAHRLAPRDTRIRIAAPPERQFSTWTGGSILASLGAFRNMWVSKQDYVEHGASRLTTSRHQL